MPGKGPSRGHFWSGTPDAGRLVRCIVGLWGCSEHSFEILEGGLFLERHIFCSPL